MPSCGVKCESLDLTEIDSAPDSLRNVSFLGAFMSGNSNPRRTQWTERPGKGGDPTSPQDDCEFERELDLTSVQPVVAQVARGQRLSVHVIVNERSQTAVVCRRSVEGDVVGSLAGFGGVTKLVDCIRRGNTYVADIVHAERGNCRVFVHRVTI